jgi:hypothetical protein
MKINRSLTRWLLLTIVVLSFSAASFGQIAVGISVRIGPPAIPVYAQPICPGPGYFWTPGYWGWNDDNGYYWVPGTWVVAPVGLLWTPGYWGWNAGFYGWHAGYWGPHIGFYGGINYGFGYGGVGFVGGEWRGGAFYYNRSVTNVSVTNVTNVYNKTVEVNNNHTSFNGGEGGIVARPTPAEEAAGREQHQAALSSQVQQEHAASQNRANFASENHGKPAVAATARPGDFSHGAVGARSAGGEYHEPAMSPKEARAGAPSGNNGNRGGANEGNRGGSNEGFHPFNQPRNGSNNSSEHNGESTQNRPQPQQHESQPQRNQGNQGNQHKNSSPPKSQNQKPPKQEKHGKN